MLRSLAGMDVDNVVVLRSRDDLTRYSRYCREWHELPPWDLEHEDEWVTGLIRIAEREPEPPVLFYGDDRTLSAISKHRNKLLEYFRFNMPSEEVVAACVNKTEFDAFARAAGIPVPTGLQSSPELGCQQIEMTIGFPCILKPVTHIGWFRSDAVQSLGGMPRKVLLANDAAECALALENMRRFSPDFVVQTFIPGGEDEIYSFHTYLPRSGTRTAAYIGKKIRTYPSVGGESTYIELVKNEELLRLGFEVTDATKVTGPVKIDFKRDPRTNKFHVLEINLRFNLWNHLGTRSGVNLPYLAYLDNCGMPYVAPKDYRAGLCWLDLEEDLRAFTYDYYPRGLLSISAWLRSFLRPKIYAVFAWNDPLPFIVGVGRLIGRMARKAFARFR